MKAVTSALAGGLISPGEAATIAAVVDTFVRAIETSDFEQRLQQVEADQANPRGGPGRHQRRRLELALQPMGEILLQIRCRWRGAQQSTQFMDVGSPRRSVRWEGT